MRCQGVAIPGGGTAIVCSGRGGKRCPCGRAATLECDWKVPTRKSGTCDAPICSSCTTSPAPDKDLCRKHAAEFEAWKARPPQA
jgi:hypothetical protein